MEYDKTYRDLERKANEAEKKEHETWEIKEKTKDNLDAARREVSSLEKKIIEVEHNFRNATDEHHKLRRELEVLTQKIQKSAY